MESGEYPNSGEVSSQTRELRMLMSCTSFSLDVRIIASVSLIISVGVGSQSVMSSLSDDDGVGMDRMRQQREKMGKRGGHDTTLENNNTGEKQTSDEISSSASFSRVGRQTRYELRERDRKRSLNPVSLLFRLFRMNGNERPTDDVVSMLCVR